MVSQRQEAIYKALLYILVNIIAYVITIAVFRDSSLSRQSYALLTSWWCALYAANIFSINFRSAPIVFATYAGFGILAPYLGWTWFYHDLPDKLSFSYAVIIVIGGLIFASPLIINSFIMYLKEKTTSK